ncbi:unnamed protein product [Closterium sp. NIES-54]
MVTTTTPGGQRVSTNTCTRTGRHLATFTLQPGSSLYTLATEWPFVVQYAAHQLNLWPRVSLPKTSPTLRWTGEVGDKLSARAIPCVFLGFPLDTRGWQFYHPTSRRVFPSQDVTFDEFSSSWGSESWGSEAWESESWWSSQVDPLPGNAPVEVAVGSGCWVWGAGPGRAEPGGAEPGGAEPAGVELGGTEPEGVEPGGAESEGAKSRGAEPRGTTSFGGLADALPRVSPLLEPLSPQQLHEWFAQSTRRQSGAAGAGVSTAGDTGAGGVGVTAGAGGTGGAAGAGPGGAHTRGTGAAGIAGGACISDAGARGAGAGDTGTVDPGAGRAVSCGTGTVQPRPSFVPLLQQVLGLPSSPGLTPPLLCLLPDKSQPPLQPASPLPAPSPYTEQSGGLTERCEPASHPVSPVRTARRIPRSRPPLVPGTRTMALCPSSVPLRVPLPAPPESSLPEVPNPESDHARAAGPTVSHLLATAVTDPSFESAAASALVAELLDFAAAWHLDYATALVALSASTSPPSVGGECALGMDVLEDRQENFECLAFAVPRFASMPLAHEGDPDAPDIPTPRSYAEAIMGPYSSQWQAAMDAEMASWKSTGTYVDPAPPSRANIVNDVAVSGKLINKMDISTAFLNGILEEDVYMTQPPGYEDGTGRVCKLKKSIYGLKQVPRCWYEKLAAVLEEMGFRTSSCDESLLLKREGEKLVMLLIYVDDIILFSSSMKEIQNVQQQLMKNFKCKTLGEVKYYLEMHVERDPDQRWLKLHQEMFIKELEEKYGIENERKVATPLPAEFQLVKAAEDEGVEAEEQQKFQSLVGSHFFAAVHTRPDISFSVGQLARVVKNPSEEQVDAAEHMLKYLNAHTSIGVQYSASAQVKQKGV